MAEQSNVAAIVRALVDYLRANPHACDTPSGVARWWLQPDEDVSMDALQESLTWLQKQGVIEELVAGDGRRRYRRCGSDEALAAALAACNPIH